MRLCPHHAPSGSQPRRAGTGARGGGEQSQQRAGKAFAQLQTNSPSNNTSTRNAECLRGVKKLHTLHSPTPGLSVTRDSCPCNNIYTYLFHDSLTFLCKTSKYTVQYTLLPEMNPSIKYYLLSTPCPTLHAILDTAQYEIYDKTAYAALIETISPLQHSCTPQEQENYKTE